MTKRQTFDENKLNDKSQNSFYKKGGFNVYWKNVKEIQVFLKCLLLMTMDSQHLK